MDIALGGALAALSNDIAATIEAVAGNVVAVEGRDRIGSSGFFLGPNTIVTADHALESDAIAVVFATAGPPARERTADQDLRVGAIAIAVGRDDDGDLSATMGVVGSLGAAWRTLARRRDRPLRTCRSFAVSALFGQPARRCRGAADRDEHLGLVAAAIHRRPGNHDRSGRRGARNARTRRPRLPKPGRRTSRSPPGYPSPRTP
jgi:hypothetical protein